MLRWTLEVIRFCWYLTTIFNLESYFSILSWPNIPCVKDVDSPRSKRCDAESIYMYLRQGMPCQSSPHIADALRVKLTAEHRFKTQCNWLLWQLIVDFFNETYRARSGADVDDASLTMLWSLTTALFIPGGIIGSLLGGWLADKIGR